MLFNSQLFILLYLPVTLTVFLVLSKWASNIAALLWLVMASMFFYGWWNPDYVPLLCGSILVNFLLARTMVHSRRKSHQRFTLLTIGVVFNLSLLGYFKYANFLLSSFGEISGASYTLATITLPLAISFYTFQQISYLVDVWRNKGREYDLLRYAAYITFFPQLIAGPIVRHHELISQFDLNPLRAGVWERIGRGGILFCIGLVKKVLIADSLADIVNPTFSAAAAQETLGFTSSWLASFAFSWQIYFDFSGYSDMAIGLSMMFGFKLPINFNAPYRASSMREFWQRWHMTLSRFLRDYLFVPIARNRWLPYPRILAILVTMFLAGLWHGAAWTFAIWGLVHGISLLVNTAFSTSGWHLPWGLGWLLTLLFWVETAPLFRGDSFSTAVVLWRGMHDLSSLLAPQDWGDLALVVVAGMIAILGPTSQKVSLEQLAPKPLFAIGAGLMVTLMLVLIGDGDVQEFYYFQF